MQKWKIGVLLTLLIIQISCSPQLSGRLHRPRVSLTPKKQGHAQFYFFQKMLIVRGLCMRNIQIQFERIELTTQSIFQANRTLSDMTDLLSNEKLIKQHLASRKYKRDLTSKEYKILLLFLEQIDLWARILIEVMEVEIKEKSEASIRPSAKPLFEAFREVVQYHRPMCDFQKLLEKVWECYWAIQSIYCNFLRIERQFVGTKAEKEQQINAIKRYLTSFQQKLYQLRLEVSQTLQITPTQKKYLEEDLGDIFQQAKRLSQDIKTFKFKQTIPKWSFIEQIKEIKPGKSLGKSLGKPLGRATSFSGRSRNRKRLPKGGERWPSTNIY